MDVTYFPTAAASCCTFLVMYKYVSPKLSEKYFPSYISLSKAKQIDWNNRTISTVHSTICSVICVYALIYDKEINEDPIWGDSKLVKTNCAFVVGFMTCDIIIMLRHYKEVGGLFYIFHHGASIYAFYFVMTYGALPWFANFRLIAEFSTPFVNQRWFLGVLGYPKTSPVFMTNGVAMAAIFFISRILSIPPYWLKVFSIWGSPACNELGRMYFVLVSSCLVLDTMNVIWMVKIYRGAHRILQTSFDENKNYKATKAA